MTATFGKLQGNTLELSPGLNILEAPNETGKSTWCAFLLSMLYGINSRERDRAGFIADKNRYAPWNGSAMSGRLECRAGNQDLTLLRTTRRANAPLGEFLATYTGTGDPVPGLTSPTCGELLLGVSREVYERSAFIRQSGLAISQDAGLERRIASLITSGEEDTSFSEATDALKKQLNRRRHNKTGQIPTLETELAETQKQIEDARALEQALKQALAQADALTQQETLLRAELAHLDAWEAQQKRKRPCAGGTGRSGREPPGRHAALPAGGGAHSRQ
ncbi:MAG: AAA family ATPase [Dysosmobacter sp.]